jgi:hypothetical protein
MQKITWNDIWMSILVGVVLGIITLIGFCTFKNSKIERYVLDEYNSEQVGKCYEIRETRIWGCDRIIRLRQDISLDSTLKVIDHLNESLKK